MELSNVEIALLQIITERGQISGYEINQLIIERGYREWTGIETTSIYVGLKKLEKKGIVLSFMHEQKTGKGPIPKKFKITDSGMIRFIDEVKKILSFCREKSRFELGISSIAVLKKEEIIKCLHIRQKYLIDIVEIVKKKFNSQGGAKLPLQARALFVHSLNLLKEEIKFVDYLLNEITKNK